MSITASKHDQTVAPVDNRRAKRKKASKPGGVKVREIETRIQFLVDEAMSKRIEEAIAELKRRGVKPAYKLTGPNRITLGFVMRELVERHLTDTIEELTKEHGPAEKSPRKRKP